MLVGTADPTTLLAPRAVVMEKLDTEPEVLGGVSVLQVLCEIDSSPECEILPPSLHPTLPPLLNWQAWRVPASPWGPFALAMTRIECRSGVRPRALLTQGYVDNVDAARALGERWGFRLEVATVAVEQRYDETRCEVHRQGEAILSIGLRDPEPLGMLDIQYVSALHATRLERGLRLLQCDTAYEPERAERGTPLVDHFDAEQWGEPRLVPVYPVSASLTRGRVTLPKLRFVCRPDELAFTGTESI
jgi:hypothetical protein